MDSKVSSWARLCLLRPPACLVMAIFSLSLLVVSLWLFLCTLPVRSMVRGCAGLESIPWFNLYSVIPHYSCHYGHTEPLFLMKKCHGIKWCSVSQENVSILGSDSNRGQNTEPLDSMGSHTREERGSLDLIYYSFIILKIYLFHMQSCWWEAGGRINLPFAGSFPKCLKQHGWSQIKKAGAGNPNEASMWAQGLSNCNITCCFPATIAGSLTKSGSKTLARHSVCGTRASWELLIMMTNTFSVT